MEKYFIVTQDGRIPPELEYQSYEVLSLAQFIDMANSDEGIEVQSGIYFNLDSMSQELYEAVKEGLGDKATYFVFSDQNINLGFLIDEGVNRYEVAMELPQIEEPPVQPVVEPSPVIPEPQVQEEIPEASTESAGIKAPTNDVYTGFGVEVVEQAPMENNTSALENSDILKMMGNEYTNTVTNTSTQNKVAKVVLFGSAKGGTGKTTTCLISVRRYAKTHPDQKIALLDYDNVGQIGMTIVRVNPTLGDYYRQYSAGNNTFSYLKNCSLQNSHFSPNLDFYIAPSAAVIPKLIKDQGFWKNILELVLTNYDVVFFDTGGGLEYLNQQNIIDLYKIADKIILVSNTTSTSVNCVNAQIQYLSGSIKNDVYRPEEKITKNVGLVITRALEKNKEINNAVVRVFTDSPIPQNNVSILAAFGNLDERIARSQYYQEWEAWDADEKINLYLDNICKLDD
jgi:cellulose biosynthesis protein BcsQ